MDKEAAKAVYAIAKGKGKGKGGWKWNDRSANTEGDKANKGDASKGAPTKGGGKGKGFQGRCWKCNELGHNQNNCPSGKTVGLVGDEPFMQQPSNSNIFGFCCTMTGQDRNFMTFPCTGQKQTEHPMTQTTALLEDGEPDWTSVRPGKGNWTHPLDDQSQAKKALANLDLKLTGSKWFEADDNGQTESISEMIECDNMIKSAAPKRKVGKMTRPTQKEHQSLRREQGSAKLMSMNDCACCVEPKVQEVGTNEEQQVPLVLKASWEPIPLEEPRVILSDKLPDPIAEEQEPATIAQSMEDASAHAAAAISHIERVERHKQDARARETKQKESLLEHGRRNDLNMSLCPIYLAQNMSILAVKEELVWAKVAVAVDSGACAHVTPNEVFAMEAMESALSKAKSTFFGANGSPIPILGDQFVKAKSDGGDDIEMKFNVAAISRPLASVHEICAKGYTVAMTQDGGYIQSNRTGKKTALRMENKLYFPDLWVQVPKSLAESSPFGRPT